MSDNRISEKFQNVRYFLWVDIFTEFTGNFIEKTMISEKIYAGDRKTGDYRKQ